MKFLLPAAMRRTSAGAAAGRLGRDAVRCGFLSSTSALPLAIQPEDDSLATDRERARDWFTCRLALFDELLVEFGAVLLRGFALPDTAAFRALTVSYPAYSMGYFGGASPRQEIQNGVYESTRMLPRATIGLHQELAYLADHPRLLAFYCHRPSETGGETPLADMRMVTRRLPAAMLAKFEAKGIMYRRNFAPASQPDEVATEGYFGEYHQRWHAAFRTDDPRRVEALCAERQMRCEWLADGSVTVTHVGGATTRHPLNGETVWFNQATAQHVNTRTFEPLSLMMLRKIYANRPAYPYDIRFGDGEAMLESDLAAAYDALDAQRTAFSWERGDVLLIDNVFVAHGRSPYTGARDIQVAMMS